MSKFMGSCKALSVWMMQGVDANYSNSILTIGHPRQIIL